MKEHVNSIFISDCHLCCPYSHPEKLYDFLDKYKPKNLYILGDFIDGNYINKKRRWRNINNNIIRKIFKWSVDDVKVKYILGNHDLFLEKWIGFQFGNIEIFRETTHHSVKGDKILLIHGDRFDVYIGPFIYFVGSIGYSLALVLNSFLKRIGLKRFCISKFLKKNVKHIVAHICKFEEQLVEYAEKYKCNKIICGHIHHPTRKYIGNNIEYLNCGDWIENNSAIIEDNEGNLRIEYFE